MSAPLEKAKTNNGLDDLTAAIRDNFCREKKLQTDTRRELNTIEEKFRPLIESVRLNRGKLLDQAKNLLKREALSFRAWCFAKGFAGGTASKIDMSDVYRVIRLAHADDLSAAVTKERAKATARQRRSREAKKPGGVTTPAVTPITAVPRRPLEEAQQAITKACSLTATANQPTVESILMQAKLLSREEQEQLCTAIMDTWRHDKGRIVEGRA